MKILIIGSGGREHALGWKLAQSAGRRPKVKKIYFAPGNAGTNQIGENINIDCEDIDKLLNFALKNKIDLTVVGPEAPLALGIVDLFEKNNLKIFGPTKKAAQLESSKAWAIKFMEKYNIPHPRSFIFEDAKKAINFLESYQGEVVVKADGLAQGKGVLVPKDKKEAKEAVKKNMIEKEFGEAGNKIVIQEKLVGQEVSITAFADGKTVTLMLPAQDHKRVFDNDKGLNTGGMGAYAPVPFVSKKLLKQIEKNILQKTIDGMRKEGVPYKGVLYAGLMINKNEPKVLEFNVRFGDPEAQPIMVLMKSDLLPILFSCLRGNLKKQRVTFRRGSAVCVVLASAGYPGKYKKGEIIYGLDKIGNSHSQIFHAGTATKNGQIITNGGRVLGVTAYGQNIKKAIKRVYEIIGKKVVYFKNMHYRKDIGEKSMKLKYGLSN